MPNLNIETLLKSLMEINSSSGQETELLLFLENLLKQENFKTTRIPVREKTFCLLATVGQAKLILQAHCDTVQPYLPFSENEKTIYGRGACDTKASIAAMTLAAIKAKKNQLNNFGLLFTVEEETNFKGAMAAAKFFKKNFTKTQPYFVVGEPSSLQPIIGNFGISLFNISSQGKSAHTSSPEKGLNAIDLLFQTYQKLQQLELKNGTLASITNIKGGIADNIVPDQAQFTLSMRISPDDQSNYLQDIKKLVSPCKVKEQILIKPVKSYLAANLKFLGQSKTVKYGTELAFFQKGCILGPGDISLAHSANEQISKQELAKAVEVYLEILERF